MNAGMDLNFNTDLATNFLLEKDCMDEFMNIIIANHTCVIKF